MLFAFLKKARVLLLFFKGASPTSCLFFAGNGFEDLSLDPARPWNEASEETLTQAVGNRASKRRRPLSPLGSDQGDYDPLPPYPLPASSSAAPARKKKKSSRAKADMAAMMQSLVQALALQQRQQSSSDSSDSDLAEEVFEEAPLPPLPAISPLAEDLAISSSEDEALPISGRCSPAFPEVSRAAEDTSQPEEVSFPDLLSHPSPATEGDLSMPAIEAVSEAPPPVAPVVPGPPSAEPAAAKDITLLVPSSENVTPQSILYRPLGSQAMIFREEEGGGKSRAASS